MEISHQYGAMSALIPRKNSLTHYMRVSHPGAGLDFVETKKIWCFCQDSKPRNHSLNHYTDYAVPAFI
jgi:hypothetical protein